jgi:predicted methyltransferase
MNSTSTALAMFTRNCTRQARRMELFGQRRVAAELRAGASRAIEEHTAAMPTMVDVETQKRRNQARAFASVIAAGFGRTH